MFESVLPETFQARSRRVLYETLPVSIAIHAIAIGAAVVIAVWNVVFPVQSPRLIRPYTLAVLPDPPPPPPLPAAAPAPKQDQLPKLQTPLDPDKIVAPTVIPDLIPQLSDPVPVPAPPAPVVAAEPGPLGAADGKPDGEIGGNLHGVAGGIAFPDDGRVHIDRSQQLPLAVLSQDYPIYPPEGKKKQLEDQVIVRYTIGTNGRVINIQIISHANDPMFDDATLQAIREWRFRPMIKDGKRVEVVHELAVNFELVRR